MAAPPADNEKSCLKKSQTWRKKAKDMPSSSKKRACTPLSKGSSSSVSFFPGPEQRGLPQEIRHMIYNELVTRDVLHYDGSVLYNSKYHRLLHRDHWIYYEDTSCALALLRNGPVWENDASSAFVVRSATKVFTLFANWEALRYTGYSTPYYFSHYYDAKYYLLALLKAIDVVYSLDIEHQRTSTARRSWTAPLHDTILRTGISTLCYNLPARGKRFWIFTDGICTSDDRTAKTFLQTTLLRLRLKPEINVRIAVHWTLGPECNEKEAKKIAMNLKEFVYQVWQGLTLTRLPRPASKGIHHRITLVFLEHQAAFWKDRLSFLLELGVEWEMATPEECNLIAAS
ncbi:hypothetical protein BU23DRAFT_560197 [Bimuria novae-zelandiae CBS 107.79]|uniref:Uncharacterized protein n=1 Tax=Bimuria novae-zelandiae CBS 107.79 TaxID=1447943 RepID=A0A6A5UPA2_9PLEO|nr:hypothetical protein BU23DRAFT_560197 [Bimuria novae-zelandiae CBS 107.79]